MSSSEKIAADWLRDGRRVVAATLVERIGSAPLDPGAQMLIAADGGVEGSVTGGCVEAALVEEAHRVLAGEPARVATYGISDEEAAGVGLMCGGTVRIFVHALTDAELPALDAVAAARAADAPVARATVVEVPRPGASVTIGDDGVVGSLGVADKLDREVEDRGLDPRRGDRGADRAQRREPARDDRPDPR